MTAHIVQCKSTCNIIKIFSSKLICFFLIVPPPPPPPPPPIVQATRAPTLKELIEQNKLKMSSSPAATKRPSMTSQQEDSSGGFDIVNAIKTRAALRKTSTVVSLESMCVNASKTVKLLFVFYHQSKKTKMTRQHH